VAPLNSSHLKSLFVTHKVAHGYTSKSGKPLHITLHVTLDNDVIVKVEQQGVESNEEGSKYLDVKFIREDKTLLDEITKYAAKDKFVAHFIKEVTLPQLETWIEGCDFKEDYQTHSGDQLRFAQEIFNLLLTKEKAIKCDENTTNIQTYILQNTNIKHENDEFYLHAK
jgi:hypothetical protein